MKLLREYGLYFYREDSVTHKIKKIDSVEKNKPLMTVELENRLDEEVAMDLPFTIGKIAYDDLFKRELRFTTMLEANLAKSIFDTIMDYEKAGTDYAIIMSLNCFVIIKTAKEEKMINLKDKRLADYMNDVLSWLHQQDKYLI